MPANWRKGEALGKFALGSFIIGLGLLILLGDVYSLDFWTWAALLTGAILVLLNVARAALKLGIGSFSLVSGAILLIIGLTRMWDLDYNWLAIVLIVIGVWVLARAASSRS